MVAAVIAPCRHGYPGGEGFDFVLGGFGDVARDVLYVRVQGLQDALDPGFEVVGAVRADVVVDDAPGFGFLFTPSPGQGEGWGGG